MGNAPMPTRSGSTAERGLHQVDALARRRRAGDARRGRQHALVLRLAGEDASVEDRLGDVERQLRLELERAAPRRAASAPLAGMRTVRSVPCVPGSDVAIAVRARRRRRALPSASCGSRRRRRLPVRPRRERLDARACGTPLRIAATLTLVVPMSIPNVPGHDHSSSVDPVVDDGAARRRRERGGDCRRLPLPPGRGRGRHARRARRPRRAAPLRRFGALRKSTTAWTRSRVSRL